MIIYQILLFVIFLIIFIFPIGGIIFPLLNIRVSFWERVLLCQALGFVFLSFGYFIISFFNLSQIFYILILFSIIYFLVNFKKYFVLKSEKINLNLKITTVLILSTLMLCYFSFFSGDFINGSLRVIGGHAHDAFWHIALINNLKEKIPAENPVFSGEIVSNYHYFTDVFIAFASKMTNIPPLDLYFKIIPLFLSLLISGLIYTLIFKLTNSRIWASFGVIFTLFSSNMFYISRIFYPKSLLYPAVFWIDEFVTKMTNIQLLSSYILILTLLLLYTNKKEIDYKFTLIFSIVSGSLIGFKSYGAILFLGGLFLLYLVDKRISVLKLFITSLLTASATYLILSKSREFIFIFQPFWFIKTMFEASDHLGYVTWELKRQTYLEDKNYLRISQLYLEGLVIFLIGNFGVKLIGLFTPFLKLEKTQKEIILLLAAISILGITLPLLFIQRGIAWNSIQFSYYSVFALSLLTIVFLSKIARRFKKIITILAILGFVSLVPGIVYSFINYSPSSNITRDKDLVDATLFLKNQPKGVVLLGEKFLEDSFISAISKQQIYFADETMLSLQLVDLKLRKDNTERFLNTDNADLQFIKENFIRYVFVERGKIKNEKVKNLQKIYENQSIIIYQIKT